MSITKNEIKQEVKNNLSFVKDIYKKDRSFDVMFAIRVKKGENIQRVLVPILGDMDRFIKDRNDVVFSIGLRFGIQKMKKEVDEIDAVFMMAEAWLSLEKIGEKLKYTRPSEDPNRLEVIVSSGLSSDDESIVEAYEIKKRYTDGEGVIVDFVNVKDLPQLKETDRNKETKDGGSFDESASPLLDSFFAGVNLMDVFSKTLPEEFKDIVKEATTDELFGMFIKQINIMKQKYGKN